MAASAVRRPACMSRSHHNAPHHFQPCSAQPQCPGLHQGCRDAALLMLVVRATCCEQCSDTVVRCASRQLSCVDKIAWSPPGTPIDTANATGLQGRAFFKCAPSAAAWSCMMKHKQSGPSTPSWDLTARAVAESTVQHQGHMSWVPPPPAPTADIRDA